MKYCGIKRVPNVSTPRTFSNDFNPNNEPYESLGDKIKASLQYGSDIGSPAVVQYDPEDTEDVDVLTDPNHDFFDIAEEYQTKIVPLAPKANETADGEE